MHPRVSWYSHFSPNPSRCSFTLPNGEVVAMQYTAGVEGFVPLSLFVPDDAANNVVALEENEVFTSSAEEPSAQEEFAFVQQEESAGAPLEENTAQEESL